MTRSRRSAKRSYTSPVRDAAREDTRRAIVTAAMTTLRRRGWDGFSVDAVARAARVTRLTVYHQFGDRRGLLEAVFDDQAMRAGLDRIAGAMALDDPYETLSRICEIFCEFWSTSKPMHAVMAAAASDKEINEAIGARNERRRNLLSVTVKRLVARGNVESRRARGLVDTLFALTSFAFYEELAMGAGELGPAEIRETIEALVRATVEARGNIR